MVNPKKGAKPPSSLAQAQKAASTHKERTQWFYERVSFPFRDAPPLELEKFWALDLSIEDRPDLKWEEAGPRNIAGRVTSLALNRKNPRTLYAGSAAGGVWRSTDAGASWSYAWEPSANQNIGAIAIHPRETNRLIVATGEANLSADTYPGSGFFTSLDGGENWSPFFMQADGTPLPQGSSERFPRRVGTIAFDPHNIIYGAVGSVTHDERMRAGLYLIKFDKGLVPCTFWGNRSYNCYSVLFHPRKKGLLFAAIETRGSENGIWRSTDSGETWERLSVGLPEGSEFGRASLALAPSRPNTIYALAADRERRLLGVFRSAEMGKSWERIASRDDELFANERFLSYNNTIVVHPNRPDFVIWGGAHLYRTKNAKRHPQKWEKITTLEQFSDPFTRLKPQKNYVHEDHHALVMPRGNVVYSGNDGGVAVSKDGGSTWKNCSRGMVTTMFYDVDVAPTNSKVFGGGAQDNGTLITGVPIPASTPPLLPEGDFVQAFPGDGGWLVFDPKDDEKVFGSFQKVDVMRHLRGQTWVRWSKVLDAEKVMDENERNQRSIAVLAIEPGPVIGRSRRVWAGTSRLWRTDDDGKTWKPKPKLPFDKSIVSTIEISTVNPAIMYVGTTRGGIYRSTDGGENWTADIGSKDMARRMITRIETHPTDSDTVVAVVAATGLAGVKLERTKVPKFESPFIGVRGETEVEKPYSHVFQSVDKGVTWTDIDGGSLPNVVFSAAVFETRPPFRLFIGGDIGVLVRAANGNGWEILSGGLPNVVVSDLAYHDADQLLFAATYGRGIWRLHTDRLHSGLP